METRAHIFVSGDVQGVFFRAFTQEKARALGLVGWVKNTADGQVEVVVEGPKEKINRFIGELKKGPAGARVENLDIKWQSPTGEFKAFKIKYW